MTKKNVIVILCVLNEVNVNPTFPLHANANACRECEYALAQLAFNFWGGGAIMVLVT